jgi:hypothetical protein
VNQFSGIFNLPVALQPKEEARHSDRLDTHIGSDSPGLFFVENYPLGAFFLRLGNALGLALI